MKKTILAVAAASLLACAVQSPADAHYGRGGGTSTAAAIALGVGGAALGYAVGSHRSETVVAPSYGYQGQGYQPAYQQNYQQPLYGYQDQSYAQPPVAGFRRPAPGGVRCLVWNGRAYVPFAC